MFHHIKKEYSKEDHKGKQCYQNCLLNHTNWLYETCSYDPGDPITSRILVGS